MIAMLQDKITNMEQLIVYINNGNKGNSTNGLGNSQQVNTTTVVSLGPVPSYLATKLMQEQCMMGGIDSVFSSYI